MRTLLLVLVILASALAARAADLRAVDGDTVHDARGYIRLTGFDAPETHAPRCPAELVRGKLAQQRLQGLLDAGGLTLAAPAKGRKLDKYSRRLMAGTLPDGSPLAALMIREGLARENHGQARSGWCAPGQMPPLAKAR